ncbi:MAG: PD40 domain-containing protein [Pseudomonadales bacterium]|nr:PD40 domain-containing protein [Pseudomonadales bacterium]
MKPLRLAGLILLACVASRVHAEAILHPISSGLGNRDLTISPDGDTLLTTLIAPANQFAAIVIYKRKNGQWQDPALAPFSGRYPDIEPMFAPDGKSLYFSSTRPKPGRDGDDWDIWMTSRTENGWTEPVNLGAPVNTSGNEFYPSIASNGNLYFTAERESGVGGEDIFRAVATAGHFAHIEVVTGVSTEGGEFNAFVAPDESYIFYSADGRAGGPGRGDLYVSMRAGDGKFGPGRLLAEPVNSPALDYCPGVYGGRLYFASRRQASMDGIANYAELVRALSAPGNGLGDLYWVPLDAVLVPEAPASANASRLSPFRHASQILRPRTVDTCLQSRSSFSRFILTRSASARRRSTAGDPQTGGCPEPATRSHHSRIDSPGAAGG